MGFLQADKRQWFFQSDTIILDMCVQACPDYPKQQVFYFFSIYQERSKWWSYFFARLLQIVTICLLGMVKRSQNTQNGKFAISLWYLKKEVRDEVDF